MRLLIISGLSGSGKSVALNTLEDDDFYCVDNLPVGLLSPLLEELNENGEQRADKVAIGINARSNTDDIATLFEQVDKLKAQGKQVEVLFFNAEVNTLLKRFSETRRKHPLTSADVSLLEAIHLEKMQLVDFAERADLTIDTTKTNVRQLRAIINKLVVLKSSPGTTLLLQSFGFKHGVPSDSDFVFDVRCLPNPYWQSNLRSLTGEDTLVMDYLQSHSEVNSMIRSIVDFLSVWIPSFEEEDRSYLTVSVGCTGGHHRSVYCINQLAKHFNTKSDYQVSTRHRELE